MDDIVKQAMAKWPNVPNCQGWLGLDARGNWYLRDDWAQAAGAFQSGLPGSKGSLLTHEKLIDFIARNYLPDVQGQWFFQNGPQRVYVELQATPLVWRVQPDHSVKDHLGRAAEVTGAWLDEAGHLYLASKAGLGLVHTQDMGLAAEAVERGLWQLQDVLQAELPGLFGFVKSPQAGQEK
jgi:hypothetical protein